MPFWVPLSVLTTDFISVYFPRKLGLDPTTALWAALTSGEKTEVHIRAAFCIILSGYSLYQCVRCERFDISSRGRLLGLAQELKLDPNLPD
jgi:hypothetical protein